MSENWTVALQCQQTIGKMQEQENKKLCGITHKFNKIFEECKYF